MEVYNSILDTIGNTPLVKLNAVTKGLSSTIYAKVEYFNPGGSIKDRIALNLIEDGEKKGLLKPGGTIIEPTSGNTGVGLAMVAAIKGYKTIFVMPDKVSTDKRDLLRAYGSEVVVTPTDVPPDSPNQYVNVAKRLVSEIPNAYWPDQYNNPKNPQSHYNVTGPEIWRQTDGNIDALVVGLGTGGTVSGTAKFLKEKNKDVQIIGADPEGSIYSGDTPRSYLVEGIGEDFIPKTYDPKNIDDIIRISDKESFNMTRRLACEEGILVGGSAGTAVVAAIRYAMRLTQPKMIVVILPDTGRNYLTKIFSEGWMQENNFLDFKEKEATAEDVLKKREDSSIPTLVAVKPTDKLSQTVKIMRDYQISQLPVIDGNENVGSVKEDIIMKTLYDGSNILHQPAETIMGNPFPSVDAATSIIEAYRLLRAGHNALIVYKNKKPVGVISRMDLIDYWIN